MNKPVPNQHNIDKRTQKPGLLLAVGDLPDGGATAMRIRFIARAIQEGGALVTVALLNATAKRHVQGNENVAGYVDGVPYKYLSGSTVRPSGAVAALFDTLKGTLRATLALFRRPPFVIFYTPIFTKVGPLIFLAKLLRIPTYVEMCEVWSVAPKADRLGRKRNYLFAGGQWFENKIPSISTGMIVISEGILKYFLALGMPESKMYLLPILVDAEMYARPSKDAVDALVGKRFFFNSGSFSEKDGAATIVDAFSIVAKNNPDAYLVFSGGSDEVIRHRLLERLNDEAIVKRILFTGFLTRKQLIWCYQNASALLSCRPDNAFAQYGFPTKLGEYLAAGTAVIATRVGDVDRYLSDRINAVLASPGDVDDIAGCMSWVLDNADSAREIGACGMEVAAKNFDFRVHALPLVEYMHRVGVEN